MRPECGSGRPLPSCRSIPLTIRFRRATPGRAAGVRFGEEAEAILPERLDPGLDSLHADAMLTSHFFDGASLVEGQKDLDYVALLIL